MSEVSLLLVDDEPKILRALARDLSDTGWRILMAQSGVEGLERLADNEVDLVISDQRMPGMSGLDFLAQVKADYPDVLTILLTAYADMDVAMDAINQVDVHQFILKPWDSGRLVQTVREALILRRQTLARRPLRRQVRTQAAVLHTLEKTYPGITQDTDS